MIILIEGRCRLFFGNFPSTMTEKGFRELIKPYGESTDLFLNPKRTFGFVKLVRIRAV